jgi:hypothetical protein
MVPIVVINLEENKDRLEEMKKQWPAFQVSRGIKHSVPHSGCGLAHVSAARLGLQNSETCLVLEDDAMFCGNIKDLDKCISSIVESKNKWDAVIIGVEGDGANRVPQKAIRVHEYCIQLESSEVPSQTHAVLWNRSALPLLKDYETLLLSNVFLPIDRFLTMDSWHHSVWARWIPQPTASETKLYPWKKPSNDYMWNMPRTWICDYDPVTFHMIQNQKFISNHTSIDGQGYKNKEITRQFLSSLNVNEIQEGRPFSMPLFKAGRHKYGRTAFIACTARDIETSFAIESLEIIFAAFDDYEFVVVESNSTDKTRDVLKKFCDLDKRRTLVCLEEDPIGVTRPERIARARNEYVKLFQKSSQPYLIVVDVDGALDVDLNFGEQIEACLKRDNWDFLASNRRGPYYDTWALRSKHLGIDYDACERIDTGSVSLEDFKFTISPDEKWIPCESAFGCLAIYKRESLIQDDKIIRWYNGSITCEHVSFNINLKGFIIPFLMSGGIYEFSTGEFTDIIPANRWL